MVLEWECGTTFSRFTFINAVHVIVPLSFVNLNADFSADFC